MDLAGQPNLEHVPVSPAPEECLQPSENQPLGCRSEPEEFSVDFSRVCFKPFKASGQFWEAAMAARTDRVEPARFK